MQDRYSLLFMSGGRQGESVALQEGRTTLGRKPDNSIPVSDPSVSGHHAELILDGSGVTVRDLGSTNGTRVGPQKVTEQRLAHGDELVFGNVHARFRDAELGAEDEPDRSELDSTSVHRISTEKVARTRGRPLVALGFLLLLAIALAAAWILIGSRGGEGAPTGRPVEPVPGNLLADGYSFEGQQGTWVAEAGAPAELLLEDAAAWSGERGLGADLIGGEWALHRSPSVRVSQGRELSARARLSAFDDARARLGIRFEDSKGLVRPLDAWGTFVAGDREGELAELVSPVPGAFDRARVLLLGSVAAGEGAEGRVEADDVVLLQETASDEGLTAVNEYRLETAGRPASAASLYKIKDALLSAIEVGDRAAPLGERAALVASPVAGGVRIDIQGAPAGAALRLVVEPAVADRVATLASAGYREHPLEMEVGAAQSCLFGRGHDLVRIKFDEPCRVSGRREGDAFRIEAALDGQAGFLVQLVFDAERARAGDIAHDAQNAEREGDLGRCLALWRQLLDEYPYEETLTRRAEETRSRLIQVGLGELQVVRGEIERAGFFRLVDLYRQCRGRAGAVAARYRGSEVEEECQQVMARVDDELEVLERDLSRDEAGRLRRIHAVLQASEMPELARRVEEYLGQRYGAGLEEEPVLEDVTHGEEDTAGPTPAGAETDHEGSQN